MTSAAMKGHGLLEGKVVVVTAAAGTGIGGAAARRCLEEGDRKSTRLNSSHSQISDPVFCFKRKLDVEVEMVLEIEGGCFQQEFSCVIKVGVPVEVEVAYPTDLATPATLQRDASCCPPLVTC